MRSAERRWMDASQNTRKLCVETKELDRMRLIEFLYGLYRQEMRHAGVKLAFSRRPTMVVEHSVS